MHITHFRLFVSQVSETSIQLPSTNPQLRLSEVSNTVAPGRIGIAKISDSGPGWT